MVCDGVLVATPAGSTAYNLSANGTVVPLGSNMLALTPISVFRPRRWRGALLPSDKKISFEILDHEKRPVSAVADFHEIREVQTVHVREQLKYHMTILFDSNHTLQERIFKEQFML
jgi:NAD+ kinase